MKASSPHQYGINAYANPDQIWDSIFWSWVITDELQVEELSWPCEVENPLLDVHSIYRVNCRKTKFAIYHSKKTDQPTRWIIAILLGAGIAHVKIGYFEAEGLKGALEFCKTHFPKATEKPEGTVPFYFWRYDSTHGGARQFVRDIVVPSWDAVRDNYPEKTRSELEYLVNSFVPLTSGNMLLWYGMPGTGKTWAIRMLSREWKDWASFHYILDPESFFGREVNYLTEVLLDDESSRGPAPDIDYPIEVEEDMEQQAAPVRWRVFILEDCGEMLTADAKDRMGQALSRLLNTVDGLIGQGMKLIFIITTNEKVTALHEAVSRPGRCSFSHCFDKFSVAEASKWLSLKSALHLEKVSDSGNWSLAELYAILNDWHLKIGSKQEPRMGF